MDIATKKSHNPKCPYVQQVMDIQWNLGENLFLALHTDGVMVLYSSEAQNHIMKFEKQPTGISSIAWIDNVSGDIVSSSAKIGALRIWNAASESPKDMVKVGPHGITMIEPMRGKSSVFMLQLKNGEIVIYNIRKRKILF